MKAAVLKFVLNCWPPYLGAGIRVRRISDDYREADIEMRLRWYNRNYVGSHFGGSLFSMTDPFYMLMLMQVLGKDYLVWDKASRIDFVAPGRGTVVARFRLTDELVDDIRANTADGEKYLPKMMVDVVLAADNSLVARVEKTVYVRRKPRARPEPPAIGSPAPDVNSSSASST